MVCRYCEKDILAETNKEAYEFQKLLLAVLTWAGYPFLQDFIPRLRPVMSLISSDEREMAKLAKHADEFFEGILQEHRQRSNAVESRQDFVDVLLQSVGEDGKRLDDKTIKAVTMVSSRNSLHASPKPTHFGNTHHIHTWR